MKNYSFLVFLCLFLLSTQFASSEIFFLPDSAKAKRYHRATLSWNLQPVSIGFDQSSRIWFDCVARAWLTHKEAWQLSDMLAEALDFCTRKELPGSSFHKYSIGKFRHGNSTIELAAMSISAMGQKKLQLYFRDHENPCLTMRVYMQPRQIRKLRQMLKFLLTDLED